MEAKLFLNLWDILEIRYFIWPNGNKLNIIVWITRFHITHFIRSYIGNIAKSFLFYGFWTA